MNGGGKSAPTKDYNKNILSLILGTKYLKQNQSSLSKI